MEERLRLAALLLMGTVGLGAAGAVPAVAVTPDRVGATASPNIVQVDRRCGEDRRWVRTHRDREGRLIRGHCVRIHRHL